MNQKANILIQESAFENTVCKMAAIFTKASLY